MVTESFFKPRLGDTITTLSGERIGNVVRIEEDTLVVSSAEGERLVSVKRIYAQVGQAYQLDCELRSLDNAIS